VGANALAQQEDGPLPPGDAMGFIANLEALDEYIYNSVKPQRDKSLGHTDDSVYKQTSFDV